MCMVPIGADWRDDCYLCAEHSPTQQVTHVKCTSSAKGQCRIPRSTESHTEMRHSIDISTMLLRKTRLS